MIALIASSLGGIALGCYFRVYILIPATALMAMLAYGFGEDLVTFFLSAVGLQVGYLACGAAQQMMPNLSSSKIDAETVEPGFHTP